MKIPGIDQDNAFNDLKGLTVEKNPQNEEKKQTAGTKQNPSRYPKIARGRMVPMYGIITPRESGTTPQPTATLPTPGPSMKLLYGIPTPGDTGKVPTPTATVPGPEHENRPVYGIVSPKKPKPEPKPTTPIPDPEHENRPVYGIVTPREPDLQPTNTAPLPQPTMRPVYGIPTPEKTIVTPEPEEKEPPTQVTDSVKLRAKAVDVELLKRRGADFNVNDPNGHAQFVVGDEEGEVKIEGKYNDPTSILISDNTNGKVNQYRYRRLSAAEISAGMTNDGIPINKEQFKDGESYYILVSATNQSGQNIRQDSHAEVFKLELKGNDKDGFEYNLIQEKGMDGSDNSSINYQKRR
ncbi:MAG: hypothetical protein NC191_02020 [Muribaculaceae bacterium]|nr:hypothetical protein [Muribaculaceae bacterium]